MSKKNIAHGTPDAIINENQIPTTYKSIVNVRKSAIGKPTT